MPSNPLNKLYHKLLSTAGLCTPTLDHLGDYLDKAQEYTELASQTQSFVNVAADLPQQLKKASQAIEGVHSHVDSAATVIGDVRAACKISMAISVLNKWATDPEANQREAAEAFDQLFGGVATFASKLPPPVNAWAKVLEQVSVARFFANMQRLGASRVGDDTSTPTGKAMREVLDSMDR